MPTDPPSAAAHGEALRNDIPVGSKRPRMFDEPDGGERGSKRKRPLKKLSHEEYTVAWICALPIERAAAEAMLDDVHHTLSGGPKDTNIYTMGNIGAHNIVIACLPSGHYGTTNAALVGKEIDSSFPSIKFRLMVGIGGGAPKKVDIRLGDVVVSNEVLQHDFGKTMPSGGFQRTSTSVKPPQTIMKAVTKLQAKHESQASAIPSMISKMLQGNEQMGSYAYPAKSNDRLFESTYEHDKSKHNCEDCDQSKLVHRAPRPVTSPTIHYGVIGSGNQVIKDAGTRDNLSDKDDVICFEMEAAGLIDHFRCLVIRGICDYSDSHKNKEWQRYASATSAAYAKELLSIIPADGGRVQSFNQRPPPSEQCPSLTQSQRESLLDSLKFGQIDSRRLNIKNAHAKTCKWILQEEKFLQWQDSSKVDHYHGLLWIKGKPGAGKSTMMNFIFQNFQKITKRDDKKILINFFFHARGEDLEKSTVGMYRSLLVQLLERIPGLERALDTVGLKNWNPTKPPDWNIETLGECFKQAIQILDDHSVVCLIDALDECDESQIREMLELLEDICEIAIENNRNFFVCLSSRHYPYITIDIGQELILEGQEGHSADIAKYIQSKLKVGNGKRADKVRTELQEKASGVFMWVVLVVKILNEEHDQGRVHDILKRLREIPGDLNDLFRDIIGRYKGDKNELLLCLQWVLFARAPLKPQELYFAVRCGTEEDDAALSKWDHEEISIDDMERFIINASKGLAEVTKLKSATVQFIHESVRDFLRSKDGFKSIWPHINNIEGEGHETLKICCLKYLRVDVCCWDEKNHVGSSRGNEVSRSAIDSFPFLEYSVRNLLFHADNSAGYGISQQNFIQSSFEFDRWIQLHNTVEKHNTRRYKRDTRLIYVLAEANTPHLILASSLAQSCLEVKKERYGCPLLAAIVAESFEATSVFRAALRGLSPPSSILENSKSSSLRKLSKLSRKFSFDSSRSLLSHLAEYGDAELFMLLLRFSTENPNLTDKATGYSLLSWAAMRGDQTMVKIILGDRRVNPESRDNSGRTPISWAAGRGYKEVVDILVNTKGVDPDSHDNRGRTPISWAAGHGYKEVVDILVNTKGVDPDSHDNSGQTPLSWAAARGHKEVVDILINTEGVDPNSHDKIGYTPLAHSVIGGQERTFLTFIDHIKSNPGLCIATTIKLDYVANEVDLMINRNGHKNVMHYSAERNMRDSVRMLLRSGWLDLNLTDDLGKAALHYVSASRDTSFIKTLQGEILELVEATGNLRDQSGKTALHYAVGSGLEHTIRALLKTGKMNPDIPDNDGNTPRTLAMQRFKPWSTEWEALFKVSGFGRTQNGSEF